MNNNITDINQIIDILKNEGLTINDTVEMRLYIEKNIQNDHFDGAKEREENSDDFNY